MIGPVYAKREVPCALAPFVRRFLWLDSAEELAFDVPAPPTGYLYLGWVLRGEGEGYTDADTFLVPEQHCHFSGQIDGAPVGFAGRGQIRHLLAEFTPTGIASLFGEDAGRLRNRIDVFAPGDGNGYRAALSPLAAIDPDAGAETVISTFSDALTARAAGPLPVPAHVAEAASAIEAARGLVSVSGLAPGVPARTFSRDFLSIVGLSPKRFARTIQINMAVMALMAPDAVLADVASDCGFADQAHLTRSVKAFFARAPRALRLQMDAIVDRFPVGSRREPGSARP